MSSRLFRYLFAVAATAGTLSFPHSRVEGRLQAQQAPTPASARPVVFVAEVDGIIHPVSAEYITQTIDRADTANASLVVFILRTPGGLVDSTRAINSRIIAARTPVAIFVAPSGARAASAGFLIALAADLVAMAPGTHIGAAHPVSGSGEKTDEVTAKKAAADVAAYARSLATRRGRNVQLAELAVTESRAFTEEEALKASPPLIDLVVSDLDKLLAEVNGRSVKRFDGEAVVLHTTDARAERIEMTWRQRVLGGIAHPMVAYLLFTLGTLGLTIELWSPGAVVPGVAGGVCLLLAFFAFQILPVNFAGLLLILFGLVLLVLEVKVASFGVLAVGGLVSLVLGSMILIDSPLPELQVSLNVILPITMTMAGIVFFLTRLGLSAQMRRSVTGEVGMIDLPGLALTPFEAGGTGRVQTRGEIWNALATEPVAAGQPVRVVRVSGLTLTVRPDRATSEEPPS